MHAQLPAPASTRRDVKITGKGRVNGVSFDAKGHGVGDAITGTWDFSVTFSEVPARVDPFANLLGILILPTSIFGTVRGDAVNLLRLAGGVISFTQILRGDDIAVESGGAITSTSGDGLHWHSEADGEIHIDRLSSIEPFEAVMLPQGFGKVTEVFALPFSGSHGRHLVHAVRQLTFTPRAAVPSVQFRHIRIGSTVEDKTVNVTTTSIIRTVDQRFALTDGERDLAMRQRR